MGVGFRGDLLVVLTGVSVLAVLAFGKDNIFVYPLASGVV